MQKGGIQMDVWKLMIQEYFKDII